jgi:uncharacterized damage-inducible protein DinB
MNPLSIRHVMTRELETIREELEAYPNEEELWRVVPGIKNSAGNLALHVAGNIQHFIGAQLGGSDFVRDREAEFSKTGISVAEVLAELAAARRALEKTLSTMSTAVWEADYPQPVAGFRFSTADFLTHLACHLAFHAGQINYHRRIVTGESGSLQPVSLAKLSARVSAG